MRLAFTGLAMLTLLAGCGGEASSPAEDAADVAEIEAIHDMPAIQPIDPERISYTDIEKNNLFGMGCGFAPDGSMAIMFLAQENYGFLKLDGKIRTLAPDKGSAELPMKAYSGYDGKEYTVTLTMGKSGNEDADGAGEGIESSKFPGKMVIRDMKDRIVYDATGTIGCGS
ncbi:hypothetical protein [Croceicoccus bisphenolivorans]|uniref:hypothetical protein n=1 Tax=Croceicoccus bisphenolivorans TaxID=1783232 RepID=UPI00083063BD|nr:hypothetical protein [Croceicoccus bisphenolivorans]